MESLVRTQWWRRFKAALARLDAGQTWIDRFLFWQGMLAAVSGISLVSFFGITEDFPIFLFGSFWFGGIAAFAIAFLLTRKGRQRRILTSAVLLCILATLGYALRVQHNRERREYNNYYLGFAGFGMDVIANPSPRGTPRIIERMRLQVTFDNENDFPIYVKSVRRYVTINGQSSGDEQEAVVQKVPEHQKDFRISDSYIIFKTPFEFTNADLPGTIDFTVCYGREKGKFTKSYNMKGKLSFPRWADGLPHLPSFAPADLDDSTYGYAEGCPS